MLGYTLRRLGNGLVLLVTISVVAFFLLYLGAAGTARNIVGQTAAQEIVDRKIAELGLDRPLFTQYADWALSALQGDWGRSWFSGQPVFEAMLVRLPVTLSLAVGAVVVTGVLGVWLGALAATRRGWADRAVQIGTVTVGAIPNFLIALLLVIVFAITLRWVPATGYIRPEDSVVGWLSTILLPVIALALGSIAGVAAQVRGAMIDAIRLDYVRTLRSRGLPHRRIMYRHVLRYAAGPALSVLGLQFVLMLGGAVVVEQVFSLPGLGQVAISATSQGDTPLVMGLVMITATLVVLINLAVDLVQAWLNPKVRIS